MTRPYSQDLRERALARYEAGETIRSIGAALRDQSLLCIEVVQAQARDRHPRPRPDRRAQEAGAVGGLRGLARAARAHGAVHPARSGGRTGGARHEDRPARRVGVCARAGSELQKKPFGGGAAPGLTSPASASAGRRIKAGSPRSAWSSSTRPGSRPTWRRCADGDRAASGSWPCAARPLATLTFIAALRHDRVEAPWVIDGPINGELFRLYVERFWFRPWPGRRRDSRQSRQPQAGLACVADPQGRGASALPAAPTAPTSTRSSNSSPSSST